MQEEVQDVSLRRLLQAFWARVISFLRNMGFIQTSQVRESELIQILRMARAAARSSDVLNTDLKDLTEINTHIVTYKMVKKVLPKKQILDVFKEKMGPRTVERAIISTAPGLAVRPRNLVKVLEDAQPTAGRVGPYNFSSLFVNPTLFDLFPSYGNMPALKKTKVFFEYKLPRYWFNPEDVSFTFDSFVARQLAFDLDFYVPGYISHEVQHYIDAYLGWDYRTSFGVAMKNFLYLLSLHFAKNYGFIKKGDVFGTLSADKLLEVYKKLKSIYTPALLQVIPQNRIETFLDEMSDIVPFRYDHQFKNYSTAKELAPEGFISIPMFVYRQLASEARADLAANLIRLEIKHKDSLAEKTAHIEKLLTTYREKRPLFIPDESLFLPQPVEEEIKKLRQAISDPLLDKGKFDIFKLASGDVLKRTYEVATHIIEPGQDLKTFSDEFSKKEPALFERVSTILPKLFRMFKTFFHEESFRRLLAQGLVQEDKTVTLDFVGMQSIYEALGKLFTNKLKSRREIDETVRRLETEIAKSIDDMSSPLYRRIPDVPNELKKMEEKYRDGRLQGEVLEIFLAYRNNEISMDEYARRAVKVRNEAIYAALSRWWSYLYQNTTYDPIFSVALFNKIATEYAYLDNAGISRVAKFSNSSLSTPMELDPVAVRETYNRIRDNLILPSKWTMIYLEEFNKSQREAILYKIKTSSYKVAEEGIEGAWIYLSKLDKVTPEEGNLLVNQYSAISQKTPWCTVYSARQVLLENDVWVFVDSDGKGHVSILLKDGQVKDVRGVYGGSAQAVEPEMSQMVVDFIKDQQFEKGIEFLNEENLKVELIKLRQRGNYTLDEIKSYLDRYNYTYSDIPLPTEFEPVVRALTNLGEKVMYEGQPIVVVKLPEGGKYLNLPKTITLTNKSLPLINRGIRVSSGVSEIDLMEMLDMRPVISEEYNLYVKKILEVLKDVKYIQSEGTTVEIDDVSVYHNPFPNLEVGVGVSLSFGPFSKIIPLEDLFTLYKSQFFKLRDIGKLELKFSSEIEGIPVPFSLPKLQRIDNLVLDNYNTPIFFPELKYVSEFLSPLRGGFSSFIAPKLALIDTYKGLDLSVLDKLFNTGQQITVREVKSNSIHISPQLEIGGVFKYRVSPNTLLAVSYADNYLDVNIEPPTPQMNVPIEVTLPFTNWATGSILISKPNLLRWDHPVTVRIEGEPLFSFYNFQRFSSNPELRLVFENRNPLFGSSVTFNLINSSVVVDTVDTIVNSLNIMCSFHSMDSNFNTIELSNIEQI
ncbi:MAG: hypothetical protein N2380_09215, partial [bacterium]|nr:hypothetical protein [bacterium]